MHIGDIVFGLADRAGGPPFQERGPEGVFQLPLIRDHNPKPTWEGLLGVQLLVEPQIQEGQ